MRTLHPAVINISLIAILYLGVGGLILWAESWTSIFPKILVLPLIAGIQNHLQILQHEGAHRNIYPRCLRTNDIITDVFCTIPFLGLLRHYRYFHFLHHRYLLNPELDPEIGFYREQGYEFRPLSKKERYFAHIKDLSGYHFCQFQFSFLTYLFKKAKNHRSLILTKLEIFLLSLTTSLFVCLPLKLTLFYWLLPQATLLFWFMKRHGLSEHSARTDFIETCTFNSKVNLATRFFISPLNSHLHLSHHQRPGTPWYQLAGAARVPLTNLRNNA